MTSLSGEFQTDLGIDDAMVACTEAIDGLGWRIDTVEAQRVIAYTNAGEYPPRIEVSLNETGEGTEFRIIGSDNEQNQLEQDELISVLDQARDAVNRSMEDAERPEERPASAAEGRTEERQRARGDGGGGSGAPAGWYPDAYDESRQRYWDGEEWTDDFRPADGEDEAETEDEPKPKSMSRKEARAEKRRQARERAEQRRQERLEKRQGRAQQSRAAVADNAADPPARTEKESGDSEPGSAVSASGLAEIAKSDDFRSLHLIATLYQYLGYVVVIGGALAVIVGAISVGGAGALVYLIGGAIVVAFYALLVFGIAAAIRLALAVEKNTRDTAELIRERIGPDSEL